MRDLHVVAVSEDGRHVVLATTSGASKGGFRVALDERLVAAVKGDLAGPGAVERTISVKEIQARLRAGESEQEIARSAGVPLSRVERFAGPILSEREQVVQAARRAVLVRGRRGPSALPLGEAVDLRLGELPSMRAESVVWTAFKRDDGRWTVEVSWFSRGRTRSAQWHYDLASRSVVSADPASAALGHVDDGSDPEPVATPTRTAVSGRGRPAAARARAADDEDEDVVAARPAARRATGRTAVTGRTGGAGRQSASTTAATARAGQPAATRAGAAAAGPARAAGAAATGTSTPGAARTGAATGARTPSARAQEPAARPAAPAARRAAPAARPADPAARVSSRPVRAGAARPAATAASKGRGPRTATAPDGLVVPAPGADAPPAAGRPVAGVPVPPSRSVAPPHDDDATGQVPSAAAAVAEAAPQAPAAPQPPAAATPAQVPAAQVPAAQAPAAMTPAPAPAAAESAPAPDELPPGPPALRVVPPPDEEPAPPVRRGRASVPGWADVLLSTAPPQEREQD